MEFLNGLWAWIVARLGEPSTWDGFVLVGVALVILLFKPLLNIVAWAALAYGAYRIFKKEVEPRL